MEVGPGTRSESGFTLIEVLVVTLIMGLLAAIAVPAFFSQRDKARDAEAKVQVRTVETAVETAVETYASDNNGAYTGASVTAVQQIEPTLRGLTSANLTVQPLGASGQYRIAVLAPTGNEFTIRRQNDGSLSFPCTTAGTGGCPSSGFWTG